MKKIRTILLIALGVAILAVAGFVKYVMREGTMPEPDYDDPESLWEIATRTERYIIRANPGRESSARKEALKALNDIALLDVSDGEKRKLIRERFPEESFWPDELKALLKQAEAGDAEAQFRLGSLYYLGLLLRNEEDRELRKRIVVSCSLDAKWLRRAALQGHADAQFFLALSYAAGDHPLSQGNSVRPLSDARKDRIKSETLEWYNKAARNGSAYAIAMGYGVPEGVNPDEWRKKGTEMLREEAERGNWLALTRSKQPPEIYLKAAENGSVLAMFIYADLLRQTDPARKVAPDAEPDEAAADEWDRKALAEAVKQLEEGDPGGMDAVFAYQYDRNLWEMMDTMIGTEEPEAFVNRVMGIMWNGLEQGTYQDYGLLWSIRLYGKARDVNEQDDEAFLRRAMEYQPIYRSVYAEKLFQRAETERIAPNENTPALMAETVGLLRILAGFGNADEQTMLGECYLNGIGVPKDKQQAVEWFRMAAEQRDWSAAYILGDESLRDDGAPPGWLESKKWRWRTVHSEEEWTGTDGFRRLFSEWNDAACELLDKLVKLF